MQIAPALYGPVHRQRHRVPPAPVGAGSHPRPDAGLLPAPRRRTRPVGDGVLDVPPSQSTPAPPRFARPDRAWDNLAVNPAARGPFPTRRRGRRPRRPFPAATAGPTTFLQPLVGVGFHPRARRAFTTGVMAVSRGLRAAGAARKGGTPGEGSPFDPLLRFFEHGGVPRAAARVHGLRPWTPPAFL